MRSGRITIADVARAAGVSKGAVSFALNERPGVAVDTRKRILQTAADLGWAPNQRARALSTSRALAFGLVVARPPEILAEDAFFPAFIAGIEAELVGSEYALVLQVVTPDQEHNGYRRLVRDGRVDGVLLTDVRTDDSRIPLLQSLSLPAVTLNRAQPTSPFPAVSIDDKPAVIAAVRHLIDLGHRDIAHVAGPSGYVHVVARRTAWAETLAAAGLPPGSLVQGDFSARGGASATRWLLDGPHRPTAIVYASDIMAIAGLAAARERGVDVPRDLSVVGFDDTPLAAHVHPALTTARADVVGWGRAATRALARLASGRAQPDVDCPPAELILRHSTGPPPRRRRAAAKRTAAERPTRTGLSDRPQKQGSPA
ncbi:MAG: LacI family DNA-binding transcriptional regulator [Geodermatophilaceae bacterium]|nr:LacI family DNA-binding transcriptional regulator [Geodermatophilaceae bacterium]